LRIKYNYATMTTILMYRKFNVLFDNSSITAGNSTISSYLIFGAPYL